MTNVSPNELLKFSHHASRWWDPAGPVATLHAINPLRLSFMQEYAVLQDRQVLDVGCGGGILSEALAQNGAKVTGIDLTAELIQVAKLHRYESALDIDYLVTSCEAHAQAQPATYDVISCMELLEHVPDPSSIVQAVAQLLKPQGIAFFSTLNRTFQSFLQAIVGAEYIMGLLPKGTHSYAKFIQPAELAAWARSNKLGLCGQKGIAYHPFSRRFSLSNKTQVNYLMCFKKQEGN